MATAKVDLRKAKEDRKPLEVGTYRFAIIDAAIKPNKNSVEELVLTLTVQDGDRAGKKHWERLQLTEESAWRLMDLNAALELDSDADEVEVNTEDYIGKEFLADVRHTPSREDPERVFINLSKLRSPYEAS